jgi:hypothetical protein
MSTPVGNFFIVLSADFLRFIFQYLSSPKKFGASLQQVWVKSKTK